MARWPALLLIAALVTVLMPTSSAQGTAKLYLDSGLLEGALLSVPTDAPCDSPDPAYGLVSNAPAEGKAYTGRRSAAACTTNFILQATAPFTLNAPVQFTVRFGCDQLTPVSSSPVTLLARLRVMKNDEQMGVDTEYTPGVPVVCGQDVIEAVGEVDTEGAAFAAGDRFTFRIVSFIQSGSPFDAAKNAYIEVGPSFISAPGLPVPKAAPTNVPVTWATVNDREFKADLSFPSATTATYNYNWTAGPSSLKVHSKATDAQGTVTFNVKDGSGKAVIAKTYSAAGEDTQEFASVQPGTFTVSVQLKEYKGSFRLDLSPASTAGTTPPPSGTTTPPTSTTPGGSPGGTTNSDGPSGSPAPTTESDSTPGPALATVGIALVAAVALARRKLQR